MNELLFIGTLMVVAGFAGYKIHSPSLGKLTGKYFYKKRSNGNELYVSYKDNNLIKTRKATNADIETLKKLKYLK